MGNNFAAMQDINAAVKVKTILGYIIISIN